MSLSLKFFNSFQASVNGRSITTFRSIKVQGLLVYLALEAEKAHARDVLATLFWPEEPDAVAKKNLRQSLYQLRRVLNNSGQGKTAYLIVNRQTAQFNQASQYDLDVQLFLDGVAQEDVATAVSFYQGELLPGFTCDSLLFEEWLLSKREYLHRLALDAFYHHAQQLLEKGEHAAAQKAARRQLDFEPWREEAYRQLMLALALQGERSAALALYDTCRAILWDELGVEPDEKTTDLVERIKAGDDLGLPVATAVSPPLPPIQPTHNLPAQVTPYFGRAKEQALLVERIVQPQYRFITLVGEGGIGKSRLAQEIGRQVLDRFPDGVWFTPLASLTTQEDPQSLQDSIATAVAQAVGLTLSGQKSPQEQLFSFLSDRRTLLILDNFEHVLAGADLALDLLQQAPHAALICTSREPLNFMAEMVIPLDQLPLPPEPLSDPFQWLTAVGPELHTYPSVQLFVDRAERSNPLFALNSENESQVAEICRLVAGIPLGLELAAASLRERPLPQLISAIRSAFDTLTAQFRDIPSRHRSMRAVFTSSWELLNQEEKQLFAMLSVFRGGFTPAAAYAVARGDEESLQSLQAKSLLYTTRTDRFSMHALLNQFAAEKLAELTVADQTANQHSSYYLQFVADQDAALIGKTPQLAATLMAGELDNIRQAWETAVAAGAVKHLLPAVNAIAGFYLLRGLYDEAVSRFGKAVVALERLPDHYPTIKTLARLRTYQAGALIRLSRFDEAQTAIKNSVAYARRCGDPWARGRTMIYWGEMLWRQGAYQEADDRLQAALTLAEKHHLQRINGLAHLNLGIVFDFLGDYLQSQAHLNKALQIWEACGDRRLAGLTLNSLGVIAYHQNEFAAARHAYERAFEIISKVGDQRGRMSTLSNLGIAATQLGDYTAAKTYLEQALQLALTVGDHAFTASVYYNLGWTAYEKGDRETAVIFLDRALPLYRQTHNPAGEGLALKLLGDLAFDKQDIPGAIDKYLQALTIAGQLQNLYLECQAHLALAKAHHRQQNFALAAINADKANHLAKKINNPPLEKEAELILRELPV